MEDSSIRKMVFIVLIVNILVIMLMASVVYSEISNNGKQLPKGSIKKDGPQDFIKESQILITDDQVIINIKNADWSRYADTHSMEPVINSRANGIEIVPKCENIKTGDIIVYKSIPSKDLIVHRVVDIKKDDQGLYFKLKGDNNPVVDQEKVRCSQIKYQVIAIIY